jgi:hypothetical protein
MKKIWFGLAAIVVSGSLTFGNAAGRHIYAEDTAVSSEIVPRLTPKRPQKRTQENVILAQEPPRPVVEQTAMIDVMPPVPVQMSPMPAVYQPADQPQPAPVLVAVNPAPPVAAPPVAVPAPAPAAGAAESGVAQIRRDRKSVV